MNSKLIDSIISDMDTKQHNISHVNIYIPSICDLNTDNFIDYLKEKYKLSDLVFNINANYVADPDQTSIFIDDFVWYFFKLNDGKYNLIVHSDGRKDDKNNFYDNDNLTVRSIDIYFNKDLNNKSEELLNHINRKIILNIKNNLDN